MNQSQALPLLSIFRFRRGEGRAWEQGYYGGQISHRKHFMNNDWIWGNKLKGYGGMYFNENVIIALVSVHTTAVLLTRRFIALVKHAYHPNSTWETAVHFQPSICSIAMSYGKQLR